MVPCVNDGAEFEAHIVEVIRLARELLVAIIDKARNGERDHAFFYVPLDNMCIHVGPILLVFVGRDVIGGYDPTDRIDSECETMTDLAHYGVFDA